VDNQSQNIYKLDMFFNKFIHNTVIHGFFSRHKIIAISIFLDFFNSFSGVV